MRLFVVLVLCLGIAWYNINRFTVSKDKLFLISVSGSCFRKNDFILCFLKDDETGIIKKNNTIQELKLVSVYTSSKAIYHFRDGYIGVVVVDTNIYITENVSSIRNVDFRMLHHVGKKTRHL